MYIQTQLHTSAVICRRGLGLAIRISNTCSSPKVLRNRISGARTGCHVVPHFKNDNGDAEALPLCPLANGKCARFRTRIQKRRILIHPVSMYVKSGARTHVLDEQSKRQTDRKPSQAKMRDGGCLSDGFDAYINPLWMHAPVLPIHRPFPFLQFYHFSPLVQMLVVSSNTTTKDILLAQ